MREKSCNVTPDVYLSKVDSKWPTNTRKKNAIFLRFAHLKLNSKGTLGNETPNSVSLWHNMVLLRRRNISFQNINLGR